MQRLEKIVSTEAAERSTPARDPQNRREHPDQGEGKEPAGPRERGSQRPAGERADRPSPRERPDRGKKPARERPAAAPRDDG
jgi:hypothetical protein